MLQINQSPTFRNASPASSTTRRCQRFDFEAKRRREIAAHARHAEAARTEDFDRWLLAWHWHNSKAADPAWSLMEAAKRMGADISEAEAVGLAQQAAVYPRLSADALAMYLGVSYAQREALRLTTIGSVNVKKRARKELRKRKARLREERRRRAQGAKPRSQSLSRTKPWEAENMSRAKWYRQQKVRRETNTCAPLLYSHAHVTVSVTASSKQESKNLSHNFECSSRKATLIRAHETSPCAPQRPFQAVPRLPGYDPVAAALERKAAYRHWRDRR